MARSQRQSFRRNQARPNRGWTGLFNAAQVNIPAASKVLLGSFVPSAVGIDETVLRTVGFVSVASDTVANEELTGAFGMIRVTDVALAVGIGSIPSPVTNIEDDWFIYQGWSFEVAVHSTIGVNADWAHMMPFDSKAKRVLEGSGQAFAVVVENAHATDAFDITVGFRILAQVRGTR